MAEQNDPIAFIDLKAQQGPIRDRIDAAIARVLDHGHYIMGPEVGAFEEQLASFCGAAHAISCSSGTDALMMVLMAKGIGPGDAVICPSFTFPASPEVIAILGATPVFADVEEDSFNLDPQSLKGAVAAAKAAGLTPKGILAVDLFGLPADYDAIERFAAAEDLWVLADSAQSCGAAYKGRKVGTMGIATATSFFPAKPLGCYGDGGAIMTNDAALAGDLKSIRVHGKGTDKYDNVRVGINGRLDTLQAAILIEKLRIFSDELQARDRAAQVYNGALRDIDGIVVPKLPEASSSAWAQYTIRVKDGRRDELKAALAAAGIPTAVYYPKTLHRQKAYSQFPMSETGVLVSERLANEVLSLPMHPYLEAAVQERIAAEIAKAL